MKTEKQKDFSIFFDSGPEDPELVYNSCEDCFFRLRTINRFAKDVQKLRGGRL